MDVTLHPHEMVTALYLGGRREIENRLKRRTDRYGCNPQGLGWAEHIEGASGEMAVAKATGRFWAGNNGDLSAADVGLLQVRTTAWDTGCLLLHPSDKDEQVFILAVGKSPSYRLAGWTFAKEGKRQEFWKDKGNGRPCFFVPQDALREMSSLPPRAGRQS